VGVSYECDPDYIEQVLTDEASRAAAVIPGLLSDPPPFVRFIPGFGDSSLNFTLIVQVSEFVDQYLVQHELRKRIFKRFRAAGIEIPFPIRTVYLKAAAAAAAADGGGK
jgi:small-conductance mechanosensitive channel